MLRDELKEELLKLRNNPTQTAIFTDLDGTISDIAPTPDEAFITDAMRTTLSKLTRRFNKVVIVTGRDVESAARMVNLSDILYIGNHCLEWLIAGVYGSAPEAAAFKTQVEQLAEEVEKLVSDTAIMVERKAFGIAVHYRAVEDKAGTKMNLERILNPMLKRYKLRMLHGRSVIELKPDVELHKGKAVTQLALQNNIGYALYIGDDLTDVDAFRALKELDTSGQLSAVSVGVLSGECSEELIGEASFTVESVEEVRELLEWLGDMSR